MTLQEWLIFATTLPLIICLVCRLEPHFEKCFRLTYVYRPNYVLLLLYIAPSIIFLYMICNEPLSGMSIGSPTGLVLRCSPAEMDEVLTIFESIVWLNVSGNCVDVPSSKCLLR